MFEGEGYEAGEMTAEEAIEYVLKRPELYGLCRVEERDSALARIARVEALHEPYLKVFDGSPAYCRECNFRNDMRDIAWPCDTLRALREGEPDA